MGANRHFAKYQLAADEPITSRMSVFIFRGNISDSPSSTAPAFDNNLPRPTIRFDDVFQD
jgi:hypothetical protein